MSLFLGGLGIILLAGFASIFFPARLRNLAPWGCILGCLLGLPPVLKSLVFGQTVSLTLPWRLPYGSFSIALDGLSAFFLLAIFILSMLCALYGMGYFQGHVAEKLGSHWLFFNCLVASMAVVAISRNGLLFLMAWELMTLASFFLVTHEDEKAQVRRAGLIYLVAMHLGTAFLLAFFSTLAIQAGSLDFARIEAVSLAASTANWLFVAAVIGFGMKAGFMPLHVWLPEAHPAAPSHVSALMSGVMIKTGIYGLIRALLLLGHVELWWGYLLIGIGLSSGILGVLFALAQHDLKRLLAYSSVENIGIITLGLGLGVLGMAVGSLPLAILGFAGGLFHVLNHALFKGLLFLGAGSVLHETGTLDIERLGGLLKAMPWTGWTFLVGAIAISGLPPFNGFASELMIYVGAFQGLLSAGLPASGLALAAIVGLALIGGLATACFTKAFGIIFLGEPRSEQASRAREANILMRLSMALLAMGCLLAALLALPIFHRLVPAIASLMGMPAASLWSQIPALTQPFKGLLLTSCLLALIVGGIALLRWGLLSGRPLEKAPTWGCAYSLPTTRMQYTASSFAFPLIDLFSPLIGVKRSASVLQGIYPSKSRLETQMVDPANRFGYRPLFSRLNWTINRLKWIQHGSLQLYILYIAVTLLILLVWKLG